MMPLVALLLGCGQSPYEPYFDGVAPTLTAVSPAEVSGTGGGQTVTLSGTGLADVSTVVFGSRNARVVSATATEVVVEAPAVDAAGGAVEVALASPTGLARLEGGFTYNLQHSAVFAEEAASLSLTRVRCPITAYMPDTAGDLQPLFWCGAELGYGGATGWDGPGRQPGLAGVLGGVAPLASLPAIGGATVYGPGDQRPLLPAQRYIPHAEDAYIAVTTPRDFARDIGAWEEHAAVLEATYPWPEEFAGGFGLDFRLYSDTFAECYVDLPFVAGLGTEADVDGDPMDAEYFEELIWWEDAEGFYVEGILSTGLVDGSAPGLLTSNETGAVAWYDAYSGGFDAGYLALYDVPEAQYSVSRGSLGFETDLGEIPGPTWLTGVSPELMGGDVLIARDEDLVISWDPLSADEGPVVVVAELRIYDADLPEPGGWLTELFRVVAQGEDEDGQLIIPASVLAELPSAPNALDDNYDLVGLHGELTLARHQLRTVTAGDEADAEAELVLDFVDAIQAPVRVP